MTPKTWFLVLEKCHQLVGEGTFRRIGIESIQSSSLFMGAGERRVKVIYLAMVF